MGSARASGTTIAAYIDVEDRKVDPYLGYPRLYAKLCRQAAWLHLQGYVLPFSDGPPRKFLPYAAQPDDVCKLEELQGLFPVITSNDHSKNLDKFKGVLWQQLDHLGNAGFDPASFRVDAYGNVLYWHADPASPLAWGVCHWFPYSRGGRTVINNLRIVQWQVCLKKRDTLEFLIPWWDRQLGVTVNQFLSVFESSNITFRQRCFSYFFCGGDEEIPSHQWPHHFLEKRRDCGLAAAAIVRLQKDADDFKLNVSKPPISPGAALWTVEEEEALLRGCQKIGFGNWKEIKESEPALGGRSLLQIRDKYRNIAGLGKENLHLPQNEDHRLLSSFKRECKIQLLREEEKHMREEEAVKLQETLESVKKQNENEKAALDALEAELRRQRKQVEKQRQWNESQASYRVCLERMIHETTHQSVIYKEEARLNQVACNSLIAQLETQAATCTKAESQLLKHAQQRESLLQRARPPPPLAVNEEPHTLSQPKLSTCSQVKGRNVLQARDLQNHPPSNAAAAADNHELNDKEEKPKPVKRYHSAPRQRPGNKENWCKAEDASLDTAARMSEKRLKPNSAAVKENSELNEEEEEMEKRCRVSRIGESRRTAGHGDALTNRRRSLGSLVKIDPAITDENQLNDSSRTFKLMPVVKRDIGKLNGRDVSSRDSSSERFDLDLSALSARNSSKAADESIKQGKCTLDKWVQMLLLSTEPTLEADQTPSPHSQHQQDEQVDKRNKGWPEGIGVPPPGLIRGYSVKKELVVPPTSDNTLLRPTPIESKANKVLPFSGRLLRKLSLRQQQNHAAKTWL